MLTSTPSDPSHAQSASKSACVRESTRRVHGDRARAAGRAAGRATFGGRWAPEGGASWRDVSRARWARCEAESDIERFRTMRSSEHDASGRVGAAWKACAGCVGWEDG